MPPESSAGMHPFPNGYRLDRMERDIAEIKASVMAVQSSVAALQTGFGRDFTPRGETVIAHDAINTQIAENRSRLDSYESRQWQLIAGLLLALITAITGMVISVGHVLPTTHP